MVEKFIKDDEGQGLTEYMLIISLIAIFLIVALTFFSSTLQNYYNSTASGVAAPLGG